MNKIMVVDDSPVIQKVCDRILTDLGFEVSSAESGMDAVSACQRQMPDAIIIDSKLGDMDGLELLSSLHSLPGFEEMRKIYCTNEIVVPEMTRARRLGADTFMMKPFDREILIHKTREAGLIREEEEIIQDLRDSMAGGANLE